jgi:hypothetical protein
MNADLVWAVEWLHTLADRMPRDSSVGEFLEELKQRRTESGALDAAVKEAGL